MSSHYTTVAEISVDAAEAVRRADEVTAWLVETGVVRPAAIGDDVEVVSEWRVHDPGGNLDPPTCPSCGGELDLDRYMELVGDWWEGSEPTVRCDGCAVEARLGDWLGEFGCHAAHLAVRFYNWPPLDESFLVALGGRLGPRWRVIHGRI